MVEEIYIPHATQDTINELWITHFCQSNGSLKNMLADICMAYKTFCIEKGKYAIYTNQKCDEMIKTVNF